jgi:uncharacterized protein (DUF3084 family)
MSEIEKLEMELKDVSVRHWRLCCERAKALDKEDVAISQRDRAIKERDKAIKERDRAIKERDKAIKERDSVRRMYCEQVHTASSTAEYVAYRFLWDCFQEETQ